uniref:RING-type E3 ubiquitin transferase n=1 Tax=Scleropages formosus TaxID=113540 RepID=A0A8C9WGE4_SCLFO
LGEFADSRSSAVTNMDESSLLDLLECSVCLERLDATAKVLPCQHTFCRRCLENILCSRNELRCPECRILVDCGVDELPANILLVRLLDGIKQRPRNGGRASLSGVGYRAEGSGGYYRQPHLWQQQSHCFSTSFQNVPQLPCGKALYSYEGKEPGDLKFNKGDIIILRRKVDENWYHGELNGSHGFLPASYIQCIKPLAQPPPQGKALYDFEVKDKDQDKDCLTFTKDEILTVIRRVDDNWAEGMLGDKIGIFPLLYVELNETAKQLMEIDKPTPVPSTSSPVSTVHRRVDGKKNAKKRHSFTALSITQRTAQALSNRHSMEISAPVLISSSDPRAAARIGGDCPHLSSSAPSQVSLTSLRRHAPPSIPPTPPPTPASYQCIWTGPRNQHPPPLLRQSLFCCHSYPAALYLAMYAYKPQKADELELRKGEMYRVTEKCQDGWFKGTSLRNGASGVFPGNYVTPVSRCVVSAMVPSVERCVTVCDFIASLSTPVHSPPAGSPERPTAAVSPLRPHGSPGLSSRPLSVAAPQHPRSAIPLTSAAAAITPPNVSAAHLNGEVLGGPLHSGSPGHPQGASAPAVKLEEKKKEKKAGGLLKLLSGAAAKKKSRSPPSVSPTHEPQPQASAEAAAQGAMGAMGPSHGRAGSCPIESEMQGAMGLEPLHRKSGSLDLNFSVSPPARQPCSALLALRPEYRVVVPYPPQSEAEIELKEGDIVFVHKKREDGWYKGTLQRTGRSGLFPGSFVESF